MNLLLLKERDFLSPNTAIINTPAVITHLKTVLNAQVGDSLKVGQIGGQLGTAVIEKLDKEVILKDISLTTPPPSKLPFTVVLALPRPKVLRRLIIDMTAVGVPNIVLMNSYRTDKSYWQSPLLDRLDEFVLEGLSQGVDTILPTVTLEKRFKPFVEDRLTAFGKTMAVFHPYNAVPIGEYLTQQTPTTLIIGAEGGFIEYEIDLLKAQGASVVGLGERILRTEAAANAVLGRFL